MRRLLPCAFPTGHRCDTRGPKLFGVSGAGQRLGPGGSRPGAQPLAGPRLAQTRPSGHSQSPAVRLNGLPVLSRKRSAAHPAGCGSWGRGEHAWPRAPAGPSLSWPSFCIPYYVSSGLVALRRASQVIFPSSITSPLYGVHCPRPPGLLHRPPLPGGPLPHPPNPVASSFHQEIQPRRSHHLPTPSLWTLERPECDQCWWLRGLTS